MKAMIVPGWLVQLKNMKEKAVALTTSGDLPPTVIAARGGDLLAVVIAPAVQRDLGFTAAQILRCGLNPDSLIIAFDVFKKTLKDNEENLEPGELQRRFEAGESIGQEIIAFHVVRDGLVTCWKLSYRYRGKSGPPFGWVDCEKMASDTVSGYVPMVLRRIMADSDGLAGQTIDRMAAWALDLGLTDPRRIDFHRSRGCLQAMEKLGFVVLDLLDPPPG